MLRPELKKPRRGANEVSKGIPLTWGVWAGLHVTIPKLLRIHMHAYIIVASHDFSCWYVTALDAAASQLPMAHYGPPLELLGTKRGQRMQELAARIADGTVCQGFVLINTLYDDTTPPRIVKDMEAVFANEFTPCSCRTMRGKVCGVDCVNKESSMDCVPHLCEFGAKNCGNNMLTHLLSTYSGCVGDSLSIRKSSLTETCGLGLFATEPIAAGTLVGVYMGEWVGAAEYGRRYREEVKLGDRDPRGKHYFMQMKKNLYLDGKMRGNFTRFANDGGDGSNCELVRWLVQVKLRGQDKMCEHACLQASRDIAVDEEILYQYGASFKSIFKMD